MADTTPTEGKNKHVALVDHIRSMSRAQQVEVLARLLGRLAKRLDMLDDVEGYAASAVPTKQNTDVPR